MTKAVPQLIVVAHGSRSPRWVAAQREWFEGVQRQLGPLGERAELTFLEISLPLFEDRLMAIAGSVEKPVAVLPFFLARGGHASEDIPPIADAVLGRDGWRLVQPEGWMDVLGANARRRLERSGARPGEPVVVSAYGSSHENDEWLALVADVQAHAGPFAAGPAWGFAPSGHFLADYKEPLRAALQQIVQQGLPSAAVLPLYLAVSSYQETLIPEVLAEFPQLACAFEPTSILPDPDLEIWAANLIRQALQTQEI